MKLAGMELTKSVQKKGTTKKKNATTCSSSSSKLKDNNNASTLSSSWSYNGAKKECVCSPTTHAGSFKCRYHRSSVPISQDQHKTHHKNVTGLSRFASPAATTALAKNSHDKY